MRDNGNQDFGATALDAEVLAQRGVAYGDMHEGHSNVGLIWTGILRAHYGIGLEPLPAHVVALMMVGLKTFRATLPDGGGDDTFVDMRNYTTIAQQTKKGKRNEPET